MMKASESDLMKGIDDKFKKLLSQFEMNMNILELKSKRQQFIIDKTKGDDDNQDIAIDEEVEEIVKKPEKKQKAIKENTKDRNEPKEKKEVDSFENDSVLTVKEVVAPEEQKTKETPEVNSTQNVKFNLDNENEDQDETAIAMGNVLKYISECAEIKSRGRKKKKNISFIQNESSFLDLSDSNSQTTQNMSITKNKTSKKKATGSDNQSGSSSKKNSNNALVKKCSKTVTNISKKGRKRNMKNSRNIISKDWISYNRNNVAKLQKKSKTSKTMLVKKEDKVEKKNVTKINSAKDLTEQEPTEENKVKATIEHFETVENKLINDFFKNDFREITNTKAKVFNDNKNTVKDKVNFKSTKPIRALFERNALNDKSNQDIMKIEENENKKNFVKANTKKFDLKKYETKKFQDDGRKLMEKMSVVNNAKPRITVVENRSRSRRLEDGKSVISNVETRSQLSEIYTDLKENNLDEVSRAKSDIRMDNRYMNNYKKEKYQEKGDLEEVKVELDEFFSEIPFVVGRSISRTFNLGLSFQHAMSLLRRMHSKRDVKEVLSIGRMESEFGSESLHCLGSNHCEAIGHPEWSKEDEEAWEENPWDPELNRRRPKCTCLPNNCTTLKNVLKQLAIKNPGFQMKPLHPSLSATSNNKESELDFIRKPALKRAQSQTRTELLRNIRNIQIQLTPSSEILK